MARGPRQCPGGVVFHLLNRGVGRGQVFHKPGDFDAFERCLAETLARWPGLGLLAYCLMPNHWHLLLLPSADGELSAALRWLTNTHTQRYHAHYHTSGTGHVYQGRFKSFPVEPDDACFLRVARYVERNALRAGLVERAEAWRWCSLCRRLNPAAEAGLPPLARWPVDEPPGWIETVNAPETPAELDAVRQCLRRGRPFGSTAWAAAAADRLGLGHTFRPRGRPPKVKEPI